jgi:succinate-semialdehyde dehydrogenase/glutarate-semialdehyde dehydrogenase
MIPFRKWKRQRRQAFVGDDSRLRRNSMEVAKLLIAGQWRAGAGDPIEVMNPATGEAFATVARALPVDLDEAADAAARAFVEWKKVPAFERYKLIRKAAQILRDNADRIGEIMVREQGKPLVEAKGECGSSADVLDWMAEEGRRAYGRIVPSRAGNLTNLVYREPVGVVVALTPWNFPISQAARKLGAALATGCTVILKAPEETPFSCVELVKCFEQAGLPSGVLQLVFGVPAQISEHLIPHPLVRKISFTGSTAVGKKLAELAGRHMKRATMELGGHAPAIVFADADVDGAAKLLAWHKHRNAGQICVAPTRFLIQETVYDRFIESYFGYVDAVKVGNGMDADTTMGPLANPRRVTAMETLAADAVQHGATLRKGGHRIGNKGNFFEPTALTEVPITARAMNEEPFGPMALITPFRTAEDAITEANRLPYGLSAYAYTTSTRTYNMLSSEVESGMIAINHQSLGVAETPFGGIKESGYGSEGGSEAIEPYLITKLVSQMV